MGAKSVYTYFGNALQSGLLVVVRRGDPEAGYKAHSGEEEDEGEEDEGRRTKGEEDDQGLYCCGRTGQGRAQDLSWGWGWLLASWVVGLIKVGVFERKRGR